MFRTFLRYGLSLLLLLGSAWAKAGNWGENWGSLAWEAFTAPKAPTIVSIEPGYGELRVLFSPGLDGGSPILDYTVTCGGITAQGVSSPLRVRGLDDGTDYNCSVTARNALGIGTASAQVLARTEESLPAGSDLILIYSVTKDKDTD